MKELLTIEELMRRYPDEWVCLAVTKEGRNGQPVAGHLIAHHRDKQQVMKAAKAFRTSNPQARGALFFTGELIPQGLVVILAQAD